MDPSQTAALQAALPYIIALVALVGGPVAVVKGVSAFQRWLHDTRGKAENAEALAAKAGCDIDKIGAKVNRIDAQLLRDHDRMDRAEKDHERLARDFYDSEKSLPEILKNERHAIPDSPTGRLVASLDERVENLKEDHGRRIERLEDKGRDA